jgi:protein-tyrosine phosphatase
MASLGLVGAPNARELGGFVGSGGRRVRPGTLLRASALGRLTDDDVEAVGKLGIARVLDLRGTAEIELAPPDRLPESAPPVEHIPIFDPNHPVFTYVSAVLLGHDVTGYSGLRLEGTPAAMAAIYRWFVTGSEARAGFGAAMRSIAAAAGTPVLYHCSAGKDRTGWLSAILLEVLGVDRADIMADYLATTELARATNTSILNAMRARGMRVEPEVLLPVLEAREEYLSAAYSEVDREFGDLARYLRNGLDVEDRILDRLRESLLE